jgi:hypothetical protein
MVTCKKCGGSHPVWDCHASAAQVAAFQKSGGDSRSKGHSRASGARRNDAELIVRRDPPAPRLKRPAGGKTRSRDVAVKKSQADALQGEGRAPSFAGVEGDGNRQPAKRDARKGDRHRPGYWSTYQRKDRTKAAKESK